jgi:drug/metabolite transporter (DMT)-like permease
VSLLASACLFGVMALLTRAASVRIPGAQIAVVRFAAGLLAVAVVWAWLRVDLRPRRWGWLLARGGFGGIAVLCYFSSIRHVGVGVATLLNYAAPVFAVLFGWLLLGERPRPQAVGALALAFVGVTLVAAGRVGPFRPGPWELVSLASAVASGVAVTAIRAVRRPSPTGRPTEGSWTVFASFTSLGLLATVPAAVPPLGAWITPTPTEWVFVLGAAVASIAAQLIMTKALEHVTAASMGIIHQLTVVIAMAGGLLFFGETLSVVATVGSVLTVAGVIWVIRAG